MLKWIFLALTISTSALANLDSVAYFYSKNKVNVLLNERGYESRISAFMDAVGEKEVMLLVSNEGDIKLGCARQDDRATCTFTFYPSESVKIVDKKLYVVKDIRSLGLAEDIEFSMSFKGSMKDQIQLGISGGVLSIFASK